MSVHACSRVVKEIMSRVLVAQALKPARAHTGLHAHERLHAPHRHLRLFPHVVPAHQRLQPHQTTQRPQRPTRL
ncbi:hypothetical protein DsansV1_C20g0164741 [Dioscorea sansibarensis]